MKWIHALFELIALTAILALVVFNLRRIIFTVSIFLKEKQNPTKPS